MQRRSRLRGPGHVAASREHEASLETLALRQRLTEDPCFLQQDLSARLDVKVRKATAQIEGFCSCGTASKHPAKQAKLMHRLPHRTG